MSFNEEKYTQLLAQLGLVKKETIKVESLTEEQRVEHIAVLLEQLEQAKATKDEKLAKKIRRILRKKFGFKISLFKKVVIS